MLSRLFKRRPCLLFVCTANLCRSPMAEGLCRAMTQGRDWEIISAGFFVDHPSPPHEGTLIALSRHDISSNGLKSTRLTPKILRRATHIFTMTDTHLVSLRKQEPKARDKAHIITSFSTLPEYKDQDLSDPIDGGPEAFEETFQILNHTMPHIIRFVEEGGSPSIR